MGRYRDPNTAYRSRNRMLSLDIVGSPGVKSVQFQAVLKGETTNKNYTATVRFFDVPLTRDQRNTKHRRLEIGDEIFFHPVPSIKKNPVQIKCDCPDFRFSFEKQNYDAKGLIGNWRRYVRKTSPKKRPPGASNPNQDGRDFVNAKPDGGDDTTGYCKHINTLLLALFQAKEVKN